MDGVFTQNQDGSNPLIYQHMFSTKNANRRGELFFNIRKCGSVTKLTATEKQAKKFLFMFWKESLVTSSTSLLSLVLPEATITYAVS